MHKCILSFHQNLNKLSNRNDYELVVVTDNKVFAREILSKYKDLKFKLFYDKLIFSNEFLEGKSFFYCRNDLYKPLEKVIFERDSLFINNNINTFLVKDKFIFVYDKKMSNLLFFEIDYKQDDFKLNKIDQYKLKTSNKSKLFKLADNNLNDSLVLIDYEKNIEILNELNLPFIKVNNFYSQNNFAYANFQLNRLYINIYNELDYQLITENFVALKKIDKVDTSITNLGSYDEYYNVNSLDFNGLKYGTSAWINYTPNIIQDRVILLRFNTIDKDNKIVYAGAGEVFLDDSTEEAKLNKIIPDFSNKPNIFDVINIKNISYTIYKDITDEENNYGNLIMTILEN